MAGPGLYTYPSPRTYNAGFGGPRFPAFQRPTYGGGYFGGYRGYGGYGRRSCSSLPRLGIRANRFRASYPRYTRPPFYPGRRSARPAFQYPPTYQDYSPFWNQRRPYQRQSFYEDDYMSEDDDYDSDEDDYYSRYDRSNRGYATDWDDDDEYLSDEDEFENFESDYESDFYEDEYDTEVYPYDEGYGRFGDQDGTHYNRRARR